MTLLAHGDMAEAARHLPRFDFIAHYLVWATRAKERRRLAEDMQVRRTRDGWVYGFVGYPPSSPPTLDANRLFENVRRTPLDHYVREAEAFRVYVLS